MLLHLFTFMYGDINLPPNNFIYLKDVWFLKSSMIEEGNCVKNPPGEELC